MDILTTKYDYPGPTTLMTAPNAVTWVLNNVGVNYPSRDSVDKRLVSEVQTWGTTGELISDETASPMNGPGYIAGGSKPTDTDGDGIPDAWEQVSIRSCSSSSSGHRCCPLQSQGEDTDFCSSTGKWIKLSGCQRRNED